MSQYTQFAPTPLLTPAEREILDDIGTVIRFPAGSLIVKEAESTNFAVLLLRGYVKVVKGPQQRIVGIRGPGELVGEMASVTGRVRTASICSVGDVEARLIPGDQWLRFLHEHPRALFAQLYMSEQRLEEATLKSAESVLASEQKLTKTLAELAASGLGEPRDGEGMTFRNISQQDLASLAGTSRESVVQAIRRLKEDGVVATGRQQITILDMPALRNLTDGTGTAAKQ